MDRYFEKLGVLQGGTPLTAHGVLEGVQLGVKLLGSRGLVLALLLLLLDLLQGDAGLVGGQLGVQVSGGDITGLLIATLVVVLLLITTLLLVGVVLATILLLLLGLL